MTRYAFVFDETGAQIADGQPVAEITLAGKADPAFTVEPGIDFFGPDGTGYPANYLDLSLSGNRTARGLFPVTEDPPADGQRVASEVILVASARPVVTSTFEAIPDPGVPLVITRLQYVSALEALGGLEATKAAILALDETDPVRIYFENTAYFNRTDARFLAVADQLGVDESGIDLVFTAGVTFDP